MANNVFVSFRYSDGYKYKEELMELFNQSDDTIDYSEDEDRSNMTDATIQAYLYKKLKRSSVTIVLLTPNAINHQKSWNGYYNDWIYDEIRYSLEDRVNNKTNGLIAVYVPEAEELILERTTHICDICKEKTSVHIIKSFDNLVRKNMMNVKEIYKKNKCLNIYDSDYDSYCSLVSYEEFKNDFARYIRIADEKRKEVYKYDLKVRMQ